jgi:hypothetical protein
MTEKQPITVNQGTQIAIKMISEGKTFTDTKKTLKEMGFDKNVATEIIEAIKLQVLKVKKRQGRKNMLIGAVVTVIGIIVTIFTYMLASENGGGRFIIAWGAVIFGIGQFIRGFLQAVEDVY